MPPEKLFGRNLAHLVNTVQDLSTRGIGLRVLAGQGAQIDTTAAGRLVFGIFAARSCASCSRWLRDDKPYRDPQIDYQARTALKNKAR